MNKIPTAEEFLNLIGVPYRGGIENRLGNYISPNELIEFAKIHVEAALKVASEKSYAESSSSNITSKHWDGRQGLICVHLGRVSVNKDSILNSYPLKNIK
jgi:hypothetical protein